MEFTKTYFTGHFTVQGEILARYHELEKIFGRPYHGPGLAEDSTTDMKIFRATCQWRIKYQDGTIAVIMDNRRATTPMEPYRWLIGGLTARSVELVNQTIKQYRQKK